MHSPCHVRPFSTPQYSRRFPCAALLAAAFAGCGDPAGPTADVAATYVLRTVAQRSLPYQLLGVPISGLRLDADTLRLADDGTWAETVTIYSTVPAVPNTVTNTDRGRFESSAQSVALHTTPPFRIPWSAERVAVRLGRDTLLLRYGSGAGVDLIYTR